MFTFCLFFVIKGTWRQNSVIGNLIKKTVLQIMNVTLLILHAEITSFMVFYPNLNTIYHVFCMLDAASLIESISKCLSEFTIS